MNFLMVELSGSGAGTVAEHWDGSRPQVEIPVPRAGSYELGIWPESVRVTAKAGETIGAAKVVEHLGDRALVYVMLKDGTQITAQDGGRSQIKPGDEVALTFDTSQLHLFDASGNAYQAH